MPTLVVSGSGVDIATGRHLTVTDNTPLANLQLALLDKVGLHVDRFANSSAEVNLVSS